MMAEIHKFPTPINQHRRYHDLGYDVVPVIPHDAEISPRSSLYKRVGTHQDGRGKTPGRKYNGLWSSYDWPAAPPADERDLERWHEMGAGVGIRTGNGLVGIDADTTDKDHAATIRDIVQKHIGRLPVRVGRYPKALYPVRVKGDFKYCNVEFGPANERGSGRVWRVEMLYDRKFFVAEGIHPKTKEPYAWPREPIPFSDLPEVEPETLMAIMEELRRVLPDTEKIRTEGAGADVNQNSLKADPELVQQAVDLIPNNNEHFPSREDYRDMLYAIKAAVPDNPALALEIAFSWTDRWEDGENERHIVEADFNRMHPPYRRGAPWLFDLAEKHSGDATFLAKSFFDDLGDLPDPLDAPETKEKAKRFEFLSFKDVAFAPVIPHNKPLIKGLLDQGTMSVLYGDSNVGKTFVAMDMSFHVATGQRYGGMKTTPGLVVYVAAEGGNGAKKRLVALKEQYGATMAEGADFLLLPSSVNLRQADADLVPLAKSLLDLGRPVSLLVIDTLSRALAGGDENSSVDMGALVKNLDWLRAKVAPAHLMVVHHTGKDKAKGARGHTLLRAATDTEIEVAEGVISVTKQRDLDKSWSSAFGLRVHVLGLDEDGEKITSCTVRLDGSTAVSKREPTEGEKAVMDAIADLVETDGSGGKGAKTGELAEWCYNNLQRMTRDTLNQHLRNLRKKGLVEQKTRGRWLLTENSGSSVCEESEELCEENIFD